MEFEVEPRDLIDGGVVFACGGPVAFAFLLGLLRAEMCARWPGDRARYAPAGSLPVNSPAPLAGHATPLSKAELREEKALQTEFESWLRQHGYVYRREPMHRATMAPAGWPDFEVILSGGRSVFFEYKTATGKLSPDQREWHRVVQDRGIPVFVTRSLQFSIDCLRAVERAGTKEGMPR